MPESKSEAGSGDPNRRLQRLLRWVVVVARLLAMEMDTLTGLRPERET